VKEQGRKPGYASAVHDIVDRLFVYGTLRAGQTARSLIANHVARAAPARSQGKMFAFPMGYPGIVDEGAGPIVGELVWLTELAAAFALLDAYEGDDFIRILKRVWLADGTEEWAWCYVLADPGTASLGEPISDGDWVRYWETSIG
jgi:gamma-glutamylcyclotransferase (GGCT)/AIG2-like uncharacterized protein YtfP